MAKCLLALGSNLGDRQATLVAAVRAIADTTGIELLEQSRWYPSQPVAGPTGQGEYLNGVVSVETSLSPHELLCAIQEIEDRFGRERSVRWAARTLDIDLLLYDQLTIETADLAVPHPRMTSRRFVMEPAAEIAGDWLHPQSGATLQEILAQLDDAAGGRVE